MCSGFQLAWKLLSAQQVGRYSSCTATPCVQLSDCCLALQQERLGVCTYTKVKRPPVVTGARADAVLRVYQPHPLDYRVHAALISLSLISHRGASLSQPTTQGPCHPNAATMDMEHEHASNTSSGRSKEEHSARGAIPRFNTREGRSCLGLGVGLYRTASSSPRTES